MAMAEREPMTASLLKSVKQFQVELNESEEAWGKVADEADPRILSALMWSWLEQLKEPVLTSGDIGLLFSQTTKKHALWPLQKWQEETIGCILDCISKLSGLTSDLEDGILHRLIRVLMQCTYEEVKNFSGLFQCFRAIVREKQSHGLFMKGMVKANSVVKISSSIKHK
ncbi:protein tyrosine phosphatase domain-containing protein 1-like [Latimeria chalumnae]|uniref:protein tyrosine phosphatase domain-containing protein 1-like n=1 Tax=Latimeria chalumnae TaxID=7897 RepID=UPI0003C1833C|nr:PREDICTED: protein tyrosine phosphatase domain-containing protein 1-like [Latimeria chalumnae]|eukprot:XP_006004147.1 PREDICTED: protein tyrosine phosphatase domain-containing protein 1-like [Latimeria chalumnae]